MDPDGHEVIASKPAREIAQPANFFPRYSRYKRFLEFTGYAYSIGLFLLACVLAVEFHFGSLSVMSPIETAIAAEPPIGTSTATNDSGPRASHGRAARGPAAISPKTQAP